MPINLRVAGAWVPAVKTWLRVDGAWVESRGTWLRLGGAWVAGDVGPAQCSVSGSLVAGTLHAVSFDTLTGFDTEIQLDEAAFYLGVISHQDWTPAAAGTYTFRARFTNGLVIGPWGSNATRTITPGSGT